MGTVHHNPVRIHKQNVRTIFREKIQIFQKRADHRHSHHLSLGVIYRMTGKESREAREQPHCQLFAGMPGHRLAEITTNDK